MYPTSDPSNRNEPLRRWADSTAGRFILDHTTGQLRYGPGAALTPLGTVFLARHGQTHVNLLRSDEGWANSGLNDPLNQLTPIGLSQARTLETHLVDQLVSGSSAPASVSVITSALQRAQDTAVPFVNRMEALGVTVHIAVDPNVNEIDLGLWNNHLMSDLPHESERMKQFRFGANAKLRPPGGERYLDLLERTEIALTNLRMNCHDVAVVFTHSTTISAIRMHAKDGMFQDTDGILRWTGNGIGGGQCMRFTNTTSRFELI